MSGETKKVTRLRLHIEDIAGELETVTEERNRLLEAIHEHREVVSASDASEANLELWKVLDELGGWA